MLPIRLHIYSLLLLNSQHNNYWKSFKNHRDPDGKLRDLSKERKKKLEDLKNEIKFIKQTSKNKKKVRILDLGSGFGYFLSVFRSKKFEKIGFELSNLASKDSNKWAKIYQINIEKKIDQSFIKELGKFDFIFCYHVIEHLNNPSQLIINVRDLLKNDGHFIIGTPNFDSGCARLFKNNYRFFYDKTHVSFFSENSLYRLLVDHGLNVSKVDYPYFETQHFNLNNLKKLFNKKKISPSFYGNIMTFYCKKKSKTELMTYLKYKNKKINSLL